jgi:hypothetical protein
VGARFRTLISCCAILGAVLMAAAPASARTAQTFRPRIAHALGLVPRAGTPSPRPATVPLVYHGGAVMHHVTVHTIYWAPSGFAFDPAPPGSGDYVSVINGFLRDAGADSGSTANDFSLLAQYPDRYGSGRYDIAFDSASDSIAASDPYPQRGHGCVSPGGAATCVTDAALQSEIARVIRTHAPNATGLRDLWLIMLPPGVDTCLSPMACATSAYAGYHSVFDTGHGPVIYAAIPDPTLEAVPPRGSDPQGNAEAESAIDVIAHELVEAATDPEGAGWMDPTGFEIGDRCEQGPQIGSPLGYAPDGAPYNQLIAGHQYLIQAMWSNHDQGCLDRSALASPAIRLPAVTLTQYRATITGRDPVGLPGRRVAAELLRSGEPVGHASARTGPGGGFSLTLRGSGGRATPLGDDRDDLFVSIDGQVYVIITGSGGNPYGQSGFTGWFDLDHGFAVGTNSVQLGPCSQTGVLTLRRNGRAVGSPLDDCSNTTNVATIKTGTNDARTLLTLDSEDNRATGPGSSAGALVTMRVTLGEPGAVAAVDNGGLALQTTGVAACTADLYRERVSCDGLVPRERYRLAGQGRSVSVRADGGGVAQFGDRLGVLRGGQRLVLHGAGGRILTVLHVAHLRIDLRAGASTVSGGRCDPGQYVGAPPSGPSIQSLAALFGFTFTGGQGSAPCPSSGHASGLAASPLEESDAASAGITQTTVPSISSTVPTPNATLYGPFRAIAQGGGTGHDPVTLRIIHAGGSHRTVFTARDVHGPVGIPVPALGPGTYTAIWVLHDRNGDTRTLRTLFVEA